jgi:hypothetical protein
MESTNSPVGLANDKYGPVKTIILMYREKCSQQDLDVTAKDQLGGSNIQVYFWDELLLRQQQLLEHNQGKPANLPKGRTGQNGPWINGGRGGST